MSDIYSDDYRSGPVDAPPLISPSARRAAGAALFIILVIGMAIWAYRLGTRDAAEIPIIRAMDVPARVQPEDPGGLQAPHQGLEVNSVLGGLPAPVIVADAPPRVALPSVTLLEEDGPQGELVVALPEAPTITLPQDGEDLRMPRHEDAPDALSGAAPASRAEEPQQAEAGTPGAGSAQLPEVDVAALIQSLASEEAATPSEGTALAEGPRPRVRPAGHVARPSASAAPAAVVQANLQPPQPASGTGAAGREVASVSPGSRLVQLGAFDSEGMARQTWSQLTQSHADLLGGKSLFLERATHNARVFYRLRVAGFDSAEQTRILCEQLRGRGVDCIPVTLN